MTNSPSPTITDKIKRWFKQKSNVLVTLLVTLLLVVMAGQMLFEADLDGASSDEQIHILSGYTTLTQAHVLFDPEHPFLAKAIAALPLLIVKPNVPHDAAHLSPDQSHITYNTYWQANSWGFQMLFQSGNNPDQLLFLTRAMMALLTVALAGVMFWWVRSLWGTASGLAALVLITFEPSLIGHGRLANDDTAAALFFIISIAAFCHYLKKSNYAWLIATGVFLGLGLITKYSLLLLGPAFIIMLGIYLFKQRPTEAQIFTSIRSIWLRYALGLVLIFAIAWGIVWLAYGSLMLINPAQNPSSLEGAYLLSPFLQKWGGYLIPVMYAKGAFLLFNPNAHGRDGYLLGSCYIGGRWDYFPVLWVYKNTIPSILLFFTGGYLLYRHRKTTALTALLIIVPLVVYALFSFASKINIGYRHFLPVSVLTLVIASYPFSLVDWSAFWATLKSKQWSNIGRPPNLYPALLCLALVSSVLATLVAYPNHLSFMNALSLEPYNRPYISSDSNIDWGQGTKLLQRYMTEQSINQIAFDNFTGTGEAKARGMNVVNANAQDHSYKGYLALSRSTIIDHYCTKNNDWGWVVDRLQPQAVLGNTINIYKLN